jgi:hypothetical protein
MKQWFLCVEERWLKVFLLSWSATIGGLCSPQLAGIPSWDIYHPAILKKD